MIYFLVFISKKRRIGEKRLETIRYSLREPRPSIAPPGSEAFPQVVYRLAYWRLTCNRLRRPIGNERAKTVNYHSFSRFREILVFEQFWVKLIQLKVRGTGFRRIIKMKQMQRTNQGRALLRRGRRCLRTLLVLGAAVGSIPWATSAFAGVSSSGDANAIIDNGDGTYSVDTSQYVALVVGYGAYGSLAIDGGSQLGSPFIPEPDIAIDIGQFDTGSGTVSVSGEGSALYAESELCVGDAGGGSLGISSGGSVSAGDASIGGGDTNHYGIGGVTVDGDGSNLSVIGTLSIGNFGTGSMSIQNGGSAYCHFGSIGSFEGSSGDVEVNTGGSWECYQLTVGYGSTGNLNLASGGTVTVDDGGFVSVGSTLDESNGDGTITIDGAGSQLNVGGSVAIGDLSTGELDITNSGALSETGFFSIGNNAAGTVNVSSGGTIIAPSLYMGSNPGGEGTLSIDGSDTSSRNRRHCRRRWRRQRYRQQST